MTVSFSLDSRAESGFDDEARSSLLEVVVKMRRWRDRGRRFTSNDLSSAVDIEEDTGTDNVGGRPRPENVVSSTLIVEGAMMLRSTIF